MNLLAVNLQFFPPQASEQAGQVDAITISLTAVSALMVLGLFCVITFLLIRYRSTAEVDRTVRMGGEDAVEVTWTILPIFIFIALFAWGAVVFMRASKAPADASDIYVTGFQWYWDILHPNGRHEVGELHVPVGRAIRLMLTSADVIHDFAVPDFRIKRDVMPGKYTTEWFTAITPGRYKIFCDQFCGTKHSAMVGWVTVMKPADYETWLSRSGSGSEVSLMQTGERLFQQYGCSGCHRSGSNVNAPELSGLFGRPVPLAGGGFVTADEQYLRDSILNPDLQVVAGYRPIMPSFKGQLSEPNLMALIAFLKQYGASKPSPA
jgi:cytochrome c oxidase subunit 2